jgi:hypothetical protein
LVADGVKRDVRIPARWIAGVLAVTVASPILSILAAVNISVNKADQLLAAQQRAQAEQVQVAVKITCDLFRRQLEAYDETPPVTATGRNIRDAWLTEYRLYRCTPTR